MTDLYKLLAEKFTSGNSIEVERITITRKEYEAALAQPEQSQTSGYAKKIESLIRERDELRQALAQPEQEQEQEQEPEIVRRVRRYAGKRRESVSSPHINAKECIALANWIESMLAQPEQSYQESMYKQIAVFQTKKTLLPTQPEPKSISTNEHLCAMLRQVHDVLACTALPMKRKWVGLTDEEILSAAKEVPITCIRQRDYDLHFAPIIEAKLKEKNT